MSVTVRDKKFLIDIRDNAVSSKLLVERRWEEEGTSFVVSMLAGGDVFVDIGANIGYFSVFASEKVGLAGKVVAFEPDARNFEILKKNIALNDCGNVIAEQLAVSDKEGSALLFRSEMNFGDHRIYETHDDKEFNEGKKRSACLVDTVILDDYFSQHAFAPRLIKMDIQGSEFAALKGMRRTLSENKDVMVLMEFWPHGLRQAGYSPKELLEFMQELNFVAYMFENSRLIAADAGTILSRTPGLNAVDLVFSRTKLY